MDTELLSPLVRISFDAATLMREHPPRIRHRNKQVVLDIACPAGAAMDGAIVYSRWWGITLPMVVIAADTLQVAAREDVYDYAPTPNCSTTNCLTTNCSATNASTTNAATALEWHVNFADPHLFFAYGSGLLAQDEMQAAEHPVLGSLVEALAALKETSLTIEGRVPTPVLVRGVERRVKITTDANEADGRPHGLYGNRFAMASLGAVQRATKLITPPTISNLIAIAAPQGGSGFYDWDDIHQVLSTAYTGFAAAQIESKAAIGEHATAIIHTGFWGCGAFGGNRVLMALLQMFAAHLAGIQLLVFHTFDTEGTAALNEAEVLFKREIMSTGVPKKTNNLLNDIVAMKFRWGISDGN